MSTSSSKKNLSDNERNAFYDSLLQKSSDGNLHKGTMAVVARKYEVLERTVSQI